MCQTCDDLAVCPRHDNPCWSPFYVDPAEQELERRERDLLGLREWTADQVKA